MPKSLTLFHIFQIIHFNKGHPPSADLRYRKEDSISHSTLILAPIKGQLGVYTRYISSDVPKKLALR